MRLRCQTPLRVQGDAGTDVIIFFNIFAEKFREKMGVFDSNKAKLCKNFDHNIGFLEKRQFFRRKLSKISENHDHNIDPRSSLLTRWWTRKE
jgi:hypothetical protein